jgi:two-component system chemotaxis sensor kinase CheA
MDRADLLELFFHESADRVRELEAALLRLEGAPEDPELLGLIFRCAHNVKGGSAMMGFTDITRFTHALEAALDALRSGRHPVTRPIVDTLLQCADTLQMLMARAREEREPAPPERAVVDRLVAALAAFVGAAAVAAPAPSPAGSQAADVAPAVYDIDFRVAPDVLRRGLDPLDVIDTLAELGEVRATVDTAGLPPLAQLDPEQCHLAWRIELRTRQARAEVERCVEFAVDPDAVTLRRQDGQPAGARAVRTGVDDGTAVRVPVRKIDQLVDLVGELATTHAMLAQAVNGLTPENAGRLQEAVAQIDRHLRELHEGIMAVRMVSVRTLFARFPRLVRDLAAATGKHVVLDTAGEDTELDKTVIEMVADPLTHLLRNAIDHGIEPPEARRAAGKPLHGTVRIAASQQGGHVYIDIADDGRGLDRDRIVAKAVDAGLLAPGEALGDEDALALIMRAGFSTADTVTQLSGRGVGMDVVRRNVEMLGGSLTVRSTPGHGTAFRVELPLTLAMLDGQVLEVGGQALVLPLVAITESVRPTPGSVHALADRTEVVLVRGATLPLVRLHRLFGLLAADTDPAHGIAVIVEHEGRRAALLVDALAGQQQIVVKSFDTGFGRPDGIAAATILGDGRVALILDVVGVMRLASNGRRRTAA